MTVSLALSLATARLAAAGIDEARLDAQLLMAWCLHGRREDLAREPERVLTGRELLIFEKAVELRVARRPLSYITGERHFYGRSFKVNRAVLIPRPETELAVDRALERLRGVSQPRIADIGTGSGCIAVTLAAKRPDAHVVATDISRLALMVARKNAARHAVADRVSFLEGDLLGPVGGSTFDAIVSNPPYVGTIEYANLQPEVREYEPAMALVGVDGAAGSTGEDLYPRIFREARSHLRPGGWVVVEIGHGQAERVMEAARRAGLADVQVTDDLGSIPRVVEARSE